MASPLDSGRTSDVPQHGIDSGLVERRLLDGERAVLVGLLTRWQVGQHGRVALVTAQDEGLRDLAQALGGLAVAVLLDRRRVASPVGAAGVEQAGLFWVGADGNGQLARYAHNEYLQTLLDLGLLGCLLLAGVFAACVVTLRRGRPPAQASLRAGALAGLAALAVHSGFDFLWHIAVLPLAGSLLIGLAGPAIGGNRNDSTEEGKL